VFQLGWDGVLFSFFLGGHLFFFFFLMFVALGLVSFQFGWRRTRRYGSERKASNFIRLFPGGVSFFFFYTYRCLFVFVFFSGVLGLGLDGCNLFYSQLCVHTYVGACGITHQPIVGAC